ncbi:DUF47 domain-containing protein [Caproicibacter sp.]|uniref:DUF47 domain-containing protein n=1 Tax=Caproicibacter sp. TaxID=2814884 RepID=UPI0039899967
MNLTKIFGGKVNFYHLLEEQADYMIESISALKAYVETLDPAYAAKVKLLEKEADFKRNELVQKLNNTFITPFDRGDVNMLSKSLDDILDYFKTTINEMEIYQIGSSQNLEKFIQVLQLGSESIREAVYRMEKDATSSAEKAVKAKKFENEAEKIYRQSVLQLLNGDNMKYIIKMREVYRHLNNCADRIDEAADLICFILMKETS